MSMLWFKKKEERKTYDPARKKPVIRASICTGEEVAGFLDLEHGRFEEVILIRNDKDLEDFRRTYGIEGEIEKIY
jgi:hypothetical protein